MWLRGLGFTIIAESGFLEFQANKHFKVSSTQTRETQSCSYAASYCSPVDSCECALPLIRDPAISHGQVTSSPFPVEKS